MSVMASQITSVSIVYSTASSGADQKHQSPASLAFVCGKFTGHRWIPRKKVNNTADFSIWWRHLEITLIITALWRRMALLAH